MRKKFAILIIGLMLINILSFIKPVQANPAAALMGPGVYYAIAGGLTGIGLYAKDNESLQYIVQDYWEKQNEYTKSQWRNAVKYGVIAGKIISNANTTRSLLSYANTYYQAGINEVIYEDMVEGYIVGQNYKKIYFENDIVLECIPNYFNGTGFIVTLGGNVIYESQASKVVEDYLFKFTNESNVNLCLKWVGNSSYYGWPMSDNIKNLYGDLIVTGSVIGNKIHEFTGDIAGFGTALSPDNEVKVPCPPVPEIDWPESWVDDLERSMNETGNPSIDDETTIQEGEDDWDWYVDKDTGEIYKRRKGEGPRKDEDKKIGFPVPTKEPDVPDDFPDINNPDETTTEYPPETEIINNPDGTTTEKTIQHSDTTRKFYDPLTNKWTETTTRTTTTTETTLGPDGLPLGPATVTVTTGPPTTVTTKPPTDDTGIDWQPLKKGATTITRKFPFSLPWDLYNSFKQLDGSSWDGKIDINIDTKLADFIFEIDLGMFDAIRNIVKRIELLIFDVGLILATRKLMGGGV